jgi:peptidoglycan/LPS O-acetylase OafA/YrhL
MNYRREIDGLRALAVIPVILFHAGIQTFSGGFVGVDVFFVISGYLITSIILVQKQEGTFTLLGFYERRARRILPALFAVMIACLPFAWLWMLPTDIKDFSKSVVAVSVLGSNILFWRESGYFERAAELKPLLHTWSLAVEDQYYLIFPIFLLLMWRFCKQGIVGSLVVVALISLSAAQWGSFHKPEATFFLFPTRGWEILIGSIVAFYLFSKNNMESGRRTIDQLFSLIGLALIGCAVFMFDHNTPFPGTYALLPTIGTVLIILFATPHTWMNKLLSSKPLVGVGLISYSLYLWHLPLFVFARHANIIEPDPTLLLSLSVFAFIPAYVSWKYIETPFRNRHFLKRSVVFSLFLFLTASFIGVGCYGYWTAGGLDRYSAEDRELAGYDFEKADKYLVGNFEERILAAFDGSNRKKVLIIGDSYAQDLVNAVQESDLSAHLQLSTYLVRAHCGNLFVEKDFTQNLREVDRPGCLAEGWYKNTKLQELMREADAIWLASSWDHWQVELLSESIQNIRTICDGEIVVFGRKHFGTFHMKDLLRVSPSNRRDITYAVGKESMRVNLFMKKSFPENVFVNVTELLCEEESACALFTKERKLISYDGRHLTKDGAKLLGQKLSGHPVISRFLNSSLGHQAAAVFRTP